jgi:hypothetical protein
VLVVLQRVQVASIFKWVVITIKGASSVGVIFSVPPLSFFDMLLVIGGLGT